MKHKSSIIFYFENSKIAKIIKETLSPEIKHKIPKAEILVYQENNNIILDISASDISSLRAACNSYLRWINTIINVSEII